MKRFTKTEKDFMIKNKDMSFSDIAKILNRSPSSIRAYFNNLGVYHNRKFEPDLNEFIENYNKLTMCELMSLYNVSKKTLYKFIGPPLVEGFSKFYGFFARIKTICFFSVFYIWQ